MHASLPSPAPDSIHPGPRPQPTCALLPTFPAFGGAHAPASTHHHAPLDSSTPHCQQQQDTPMHDSSELQAEPDEKPSLPGLEDDAGGQVTQHYCHQEDTCTTANAALAAAMPSPSSFSRKRPLSAIWPADSEPLCGETAHIGVHHRSLSAEGVQAVVGSPEKLLHKLAEEGPRLNLGTEVPATVRPGNLGNASASPAGASSGSIPATDTTPASPLQAAPPSQAQEHAIHGPPAGQAQPGTADMPTRAVAPVQQMLPVLVAAVPVGSESQPLGHSKAAATVPPATAAAQQEGGRQAAQPAPNDTATDASMQGPAHTADPTMQAEQAVPQAPLGDNHHHSGGSTTQEATAPPLALPASLPAPPQPPPQHQQLACVPSPIQQPGCAVQKPWPAPPPSSQPIPAPTPPSQPGTTASSSPPVFRGIPLSEARVAQLYATFSQPPVVRRPSPIRGALGPTPYAPRPHSIVPQLHSQLSRLHPDSMRAATPPSGAAVGSWGAPAAPGGPGGPPQLQPSGPQRLNNGSYTAKAGGLIYSAGSQGPQRRWSRGYPVPMGWAEPGPPAEDDYRTWLHRRATPPAQHPPTGHSHYDTGLTGPSDPESWEQHGAAMGVGAWAHDPDELASMLYGHDLPMLPHDLIDHTPHMGPPRVPPPAMEAVEHALPLPLPPAAGAAPPGCGHEGRGLAPLLGRGSSLAVSGITREGAQPDTPCSAPVYADMYCELGGGDRAASRPVDSGWVGDNKQAASMDNAGLPPHPAESWLPQLQLPAPASLTTAPGTTPPPPMVSGRPSSISLGRSSSDTTPLRSSGSPDVLEAVRNLARTQSAAEVHARELATGVAAAAAAALAAQRWDAAGRPAAVGGLPAEQPASAPRAADPHQQPVQQALPGTGNSSPGTLPATAAEHTPRAPVPHWPSDLSPSLGFKQLSVDPPASRTHMDWELHAGQLPPAHSQAMPGQQMPPASYSQPVPPQHFSGRPIPELNREGAAARQQQWGLPAQPAVGRRQPPAQPMPSWGSDAYSAGGELSGQSRGLVAAVPPQHVPRSFSRQQGLFKHHSMPAGDSSAYPLIDRAAPPDHPYDHWTNHALHSQGPGYPHRGAAPNDLMASPGVFRGVPRAPVPNFRQPGPVPSQPTLHSQMSLPAFPSSHSLQHAMHPQHQSMLPVAPLYPHGSDATGLAHTQSLSSMRRSQPLVPLSDVGGMAHTTLVTTGIPPARDLHRAGSAASEAMQGGAGDGGGVHPQLPAPPQHQLPPPQQHQRPQGSMDEAQQAAAIAAAAVAASATQPVTPSLSTLLALAAAGSSDRDHVSTGDVETVDRATAHATALANHAARRKQAAPDPHTLSQADTSGDMAELVAAVQAGANAQGKKQRENLPKVSVVALKRWLYEHIFHPYPTEAEKNDLLKLTGIDMLQLNNWFINARVRIWRPIVTTVYNQHYERMLDLAQHSGDELHIDKLKEALRNAPAQIALIHQDEEACQCLRDAADRAAQTLLSEESNKGNKKSKKSGTARGAGAGGADVQGGSGGVQGGVEGA